MLTGTLTVASSGGVLTITAEDITLAFGPTGSELVEITDGSLTLTVSEDGVVGTVTATVDVALGNLSVDDAEVQPARSTPPAPTRGSGWWSTSPVSTLTDSSGDTLGSITDGTFSIEHQGAVTVADRLGATTTASSTALPPSSTTTASSCSSPRAPTPASRATSADRSR